MNIIRAIRVAAISSFACLSLVIALVGAAVTTSPFVAQAAAYSEGSPPPPPPPPPAGVLPPQVPIAPAGTTETVEVGAAPTTPSTGSPSSGVSSDSAQPAPAAGVPAQSSDAPSAADTTPARPLTKTVLFRCSLAKTRGHAKRGHRCPKSARKKHKTTGKTATAASVNAIQGQPYMAETSCNGTLSASDGQLSGLDFEPGYIAISPFAAPGSGFSTQVISSSVWVYFYSSQEWVQLPWSNAVVAQPNYGNSVSIGPTSGSPWLTAGQIGSAGYVYIYAEYYWWSGIGNGAGQWVGPAWVPTTEYIQVAGTFARSASSSCYIG